MEGDINDLAFFGVMYVYLIVITRHLIREYLRHGKEKEAQEQEQERKDKKTL